MDTTTEIETEIAQIRMHVSDTPVLTGRDAIEYAAKYDVPLCKYADPIEGAREGLAFDEAREIARQNPNLIYVEVNERFRSEKAFYAALAAYPDTTRFISSSRNHTRHTRNGGECARMGTHQQLRRAEAEIVDVPLDPPTLRYERSSMDGDDGAVRLVWVLRD